jgi:hypothetical protein
VQHSSPVRNVRTRERNRPAFAQARKAMKESVPAVAISSIKIPTSTLVGDIISWMNLRTGTCLLATGTCIVGHPLPTTQNTNREQCVHLGRPSTTPSLPVDCYEPTVKMHHRGAHLLIPFEGNKEHRLPCSNVCTTSIRHQRRGSRRLDHVIASASDNNYSSCQRDDRFRVCLLIDSVIDF